MLAKNGFKDIKDQKFTYLNEIMLLKVEPTGLDTPTFTYSFIYDAQIHHIVRYHRWNSSLTLKQLKLLLYNSRMNLIDW